MKHTRRRRHLRPRPSRSQIRQQIGRVCSTMQMFRLEWLLEARRPQPDQNRLRLLHNYLVLMQDEVSSLESM